MELSQSMRESTYNSFGALTLDPARGISSITYDNLGNPLKIQYSGGQSTSNVYSASGEKLKTVHSTNVAAQASALPLTGSDGISMLADDIKVVVGTDRSVVEYHGNVIYRNGKADTVLFPGGYATINGTAVTFHYYTQDYLGNNRAVINGSTGAIEQTVSYYPYGGVIPGLSTNLSAQPYKFGGKELITANGLNEYDFGARQYFSAVPGFTKPDPLCEKYYWLSPYLYCMNNPVNAIDPDGRDVFLYATTLPDGPDYGKFYRQYGPTHTFITVVQGDEVSYFAYGSEIDGIEGATKGHLTQRSYSQDKKVYTSNGDNKNLKVRIKIDPPKGMTSEEFDNVVIDVAKSYGDQEGIKYHFATMSETTGNCNSSSSTILFKAGVSKERLSEIKDMIPGLNWGFGDIKPWTESEQKNALMNIKESFTRLLYYEKLEESLH